MTVEALAAGNRFAGFFLLSCFLGPLILWVLEWPASRPDPLVKRVMWTGLLGALASGILSFWFLRQDHRPMNPGIGVRVVAAFDLARIGLLALMGVLRLLVRGDRATVFQRSGLFVMCSLVVISTVPDSLLHAGAVNPGKVVVMAVHTFSWMLVAGGILVLRLGLHPDRPDLLGPVSVQRIVNLLVWGMGGVVISMAVSHDGTTGRGGPMNQRLSLFILVAVLAGAMAAIVWWVRRVQKTHAARSSHIQHPPRWEDLGE